MLELPKSLSRVTASELLSDPDTPALSALVALSCFVQDDFLDEGGQPYSEHELSVMLEGSNIKPADEVLTRICGLLFAVSGEEFTDSRPHFLRMVGAISAGDIYAYEDTDEQPSLADIYWALYQIGLTVEDDIVAELSPSVARFISRIAEDEAEDVDALAVHIEQEGGTADELKPYADTMLTFRRVILASQLQRLGCEAHWLEDMDPDLAREIGQAGQS